MDDSLNSIGVLSVDEADRNRSTTLDISRLLQPRRTWLLKNVNPNNVGYERADALMRRRLALGQP